ncbi:hypothetical protein OGAPHI_004527 [Ogataea philodendri]|uniref:RFX-type winged-helix domain-containing protein n=1 Tax=Ogataea philodendri TaxID=1378263 RepID=A0A9P8P5S7_9ASCO|nr:uncharacterized protein OGAPHI_004527 [Ogataea philodendri]KAH3666338.1 hypothetical protein OGAPHI_004527 [Ogataea philodendri]
MYNIKSYTPPSFESRNGSETPVVSNVRVMPLEPVASREQEMRFLETNRQLKTDAYNYYNVSGTNFKGPPEVERIQLAFESGIDEEIDYYLGHLVFISKDNPELLKFKSGFTFLIEPLSKYFDCTVLDPAAENSDLNRCLDAALIIRNTVQDIDNSQVISMNFKIKEVLLKIVNNRIILDSVFTDDSYEQLKELLRYSMDIIEAISSYLAPAPLQDPLFLSLVQLLKTTQDRSVIITALRSLSRLMYNTKKEGDAADHLDNEILDTVVSYLSLAANEKNDNDELLITALDFLYQFILPGRTQKLLSSEINRSVLRTFLPRLLTYKQSYKTEFTQEMPILKLAKKSKEGTPSNPPLLPERLVASLNNLAEPNRATAWMRCSYKATEEGDVTQISLWRSYEAQFQKSSAGSNHRLLPAVDFIKNVQHAFPNSNAMVLSLPDGTRKFIIKGIEPRTIPVDIDQGKIEALTDRATTADRNESSGEISQEPYQPIQYNYNDYLSLTEINTSASLLISELVSVKQGKELFVGQKELLVDSLLKVPNLLPYVLGAIQALEY